jgi:hypothetical protein
MLRRPRRLLALGVAFVLLFAPCAVVGLIAGVGVPPVTLLFGGLVAVGLAVACCSAWVLRRWDRHPDVVTLARYGPPAEVLKAIDAEMIDDQTLVRFGRVYKSFAPLATRAGLELAGSQAILTDSWLIHLWGEDGHRFNLMRLDDLVYAARSVDFRVDGLGPVLVLIDRQNFRLTLYGTDAGIGGLLAEVLARVPWALERFDAEGERAWGQDRTGIVADVDRRREQFRGDQPGAPTTPT